MANLHLVYVLLVLSLALSCTATTYMVGDNSGWDISSDLDSWTLGKKFTVGDVVVFQYGSTHTVNEVTQQSYDGCNTTVYIKSYTDGNTSIPLTTAGEKYFVCGNKLHCLGGMKLQLNVEKDQSNSSASAPESSSVSQPSSKNNNPSAIVPTSSGFVHGGRDCLVLAFLGFMAAVLWVV